MQGSDISVRTDIHETWHLKYGSALYTKTRQFRALSMTVQLAGRSRWRSCQARLLVPPQTDRSPRNRLATGTQDIIGTQNLM